VDVSEHLAAGLRVTTGLLAYVAAARALGVGVVGAPVSSPYLRAGLALVAAVVVLAVVDAAPAAVRGERPSFGERSYLYSARGLFALIAFFVLTAGLADGLRGAGLGDWAAVAIGAVVAAGVSFGSLVAYYWWTGPPAPADADADVNG
jgi:hypothetical protein